MTPPQLTRESLCYAVFKYFPGAVLVTFPLFVHRLHCFLMESFFIVGDMFTMSSMENELGSCS